MNILFAKTILYAYPVTDAVIEQIDELVEKRALSSFSDFSPAFDQCLSVVKLSMQKDILFILKKKVIEILPKFKLDEEDCLDYKYFKLKPKEHYKDFDTSSRAYFRKQIKIAEKAAKRLENAGITDEFFEKYCLKIDFIKKLYERVKEKEELSFKNKPKVNNQIAYSKSFSS